MDRFIFCRLGRFASCRSIDVFHGLLLVAREASVQEIHVAVDRRARGISGSSFDLLRPVGFNSSIAGRRDSQLFHFWNLGPQVSDQRPGISGGEDQNGFLPKGVGLEPGRSFAELPR